MYGIHEELKNAEMNLYRYKSYKFHRWHYNLNASKQSYFMWILHNRHNHTNFVRSDEIKRLVYYK